jgi:hypothetical protein
LKYSNKFFLTGWLYLLIIACSNNVELSPFTSDGCSLFPDSSLITKQDWCECCFQHDLAYWQGGTEEERESADSRLKQCVLEKTGDKILAKIMYDGVRFGGSPYFYNWYRWGYGWSYLGNHRGMYQALTEAQQQQAKKLIEQYLASNETNYCGAY